jgi:Fe-S-cluster containining protein
MTPSLTDTLCTSCGLCCDGTLFADVELAGRAEATRLEVLGLTIEDDDSDGELLALPCGALRGTRCGIYAHRPSCCRTFECRLLQAVRRGSVAVDQAAERIAGTLAQIRHVKQLQSQLGQPAAGLPLRERCAEALAKPPHADPDVNRTRAELEAAMAGVEFTVRTTFLGGRAPLEHAPGEPER